MLVWLQINIFKKKNNFRITSFSTEGLSILCLDGWVFGFLIQLSVASLHINLCVWTLNSNSFVLEHNIKAMCFLGGGVPFKKIISVTVLLVGVFCLLAGCSSTFGIISAETWTFPPAASKWESQFCFSHFFSFSRSHSAHR